MSEQPEKDFERIQSLGFTLAKARNAVAAELDAALKDVGVTSHQLGILLAISRNTAKSAVQLSKLLAVDPALMTRMLDRLERRGYIQRSRSERDRRRVDLTLTQAGHDAVARTQRADSAIPGSCLAHFTNPEFETLGRLLGKLLEG